MSAHPSDDATLTLPAVAKMLGMVPRTLQRREEELTSVGAEKVNGHWRIPASSVETLRTMLNTSDTKTKQTDATKNQSDMSSDASHDDCRAEMERLRVELATIRGELSVARAIASEREDTIRDLRAERDKLIDAQAQNTASNAALAMSLRESMQMIEQRGVENVAPAPASTDVQSDGPTTPDTATGRREDHDGPLSRWFRRRP